MNDIIFRKYDIRGIVDKEFSINDAGIIAKAIVTYFLQKNKDISTVIVGMDGRTHSPAIKKNVIDTIMGMGINVIDIGLCPTPVFYFSVFTNEMTSSGLIITASHNPREYNGFKICFETETVWGDQLQEIRRLCDDFLSVRPSAPVEVRIKKEEALPVRPECSPKHGVRRGMYRGTSSACNVVDTYISWLEKHFSHLKDASIPAIIDCGNGTAGVVLPKLIKQMNWKNIKLLFEEVDGTFPNRGADPTVPANMQKAITQVKTDPELTFGIGFDADCDRVVAITKNGNLIDGDKLLVIYAKQVLQDNPGTSIVLDIKSSQVVIEELKKMGAQNIISPTGHALIKDTMKKNNALLAGELSGHFFFKDRYFGYDDGIYAMMRLFEILHQGDQSLEDMLSALPVSVASPEYRITCEEDKKTAIIEDVKDYFAKKADATITTVDGVRIQLDYGWGLARASNTQPVISLRFESDSQEGLQKIKDDFIKVLLSHFEESFLRKELGR